MVIRSILLQFGIFYAHWVYFLVILVYWFYVCVDQSAIQDLPVTARL
jgi:hypothetical protein